MISNPATQNMTAAVKIRITVSNVPRMAIHAAVGAIPMANPSTRCDSTVKRFVYEYPNTITKASGASFRQSEFSIAVEMTNTAEQNTVKPQANDLERTFVGIARILVRGLRESISASITRFSVIAADRAETIANVIQPIFAHVCEKPRELFCLSLIHISEPTRPY